MAPKLKPCPFCGGSGEFLERKFHGDSSVQIARCSECNVERGYGCWVDGDTDAQQKKAARDWNERCAPDG